jgi:hypothetical protein
MDKMLLIIKIWPLVLEWVDLAKRTVAAIKPLLPAAKRESLDAMPAALELPTTEELIEMTRAYYRDRQIALPPDEPREVAES